MIITRGPGPFHEQKALEGIVKKRNEFNRFYFLNTHQDCIAMKTTNMLARFERKIDLYKTITLVNLQ